jgi:predicted Zn-dependent peptidase
LGTQIINRSHPDYQKFLVTNEILGGFFGSRLMKNIREDKGFTYGIGASVNVFEHEAYMVIGTDVKKEVANQTFEEIEKEIKMLQTTLVDEEELAIVKNYILGSFMGSINTPFSLIDKYKTLHYSNLNYDYYDRYYETISQISAETVREIAQQYLNYDEMVKISVG